MLHIYNSLKCKKFPTILLFLTLISNHAFSGGKPEDRPLVLDKTFTVGELDNGLKYYIRPSDSNTDAVYMYIGINTGSVDETDEEQGLSHYLEHMAFNSSKKYNRKSYYEIEKKLGLTLNGKNSYGAYTRKYKIEFFSVLKDIRDDRLNPWFDIMSQKVLHMTFDKSEVDAERGIILTEMSWGETLNGDLKHDFYIDTFLHNTRFPTRRVYGKTNVVLNANPENLRNLYEKWFTPSNIMVALIGDISVTKAKTLLNTYFNVASKKVSPPKPERYFGDSSELYKKGRVFPFLKDNKITIAHTQLLQPMKQVKDLKEYVLAGALDNYFSELLDYYLFQQSFKSSIIDVSLNANTLENLLNSVQISVQIKEGELKSGIEEAKNFLSGVYAHLSTEEALNKVRVKVERKLNNLIYSGQDDNKTLATKAMDNAYYNVPIIDMAASAKKYKDIILSRLTNEDLQNYLDVLYESHTNRSIAVYVDEADKEFVEEDGSLSDTLNIDQLLSKEFTPASYIASERHLNINFKENEQERSIVEEMYSQEFMTYTWKLSNGMTVYFNHIDKDDGDKLKLAISSFNIPIQHSVYRTHPIYKKFLEVFLEYFKFYGVPFNKVMDAFKSTWNIDESGFKFQTYSSSNIEDPFKQLLLIYKHTEISDEEAQKIKELTRQNINALHYDTLESSVLRIDNVKYANLANFKDTLDPSQIEDIRDNDITNFFNQVFSAKDNSFLIVSNEDVNRIKELVVKWIASIPSSRYFNTDMTEQQFPVEKNFSKTYIRPDDRNASYVIYGTYERGTDKSNSAEASPKDKGAKLRTSAFELSVDLNEDKAQKLKTQITQEILSRLAVSYLQNQIRVILREERGLVYFAKSEISHTTKPVDERLFYSVMPSTVEDAEQLSKEFKSFLNNLTPVNHNDFLLSKREVKVFYENYFKDLNYNINTTLDSLQNYIVNGTVPVLEKDRDFVTKTLEEISEQELNDYMHDIFDNNSFTIITKPSNLQ